MSDANAMLGGEPPAPPAPPAPSPGGAPPAPLAPGDGATPPGAPPPGTPTAIWTDGLDDDAKAFATTKGYKGPADALADLRAAAPPDSPEAYNLPVPAGEDPAFAKAVAPLMHKAGLSAAQAKALAEGWNELGAQQRAAAAQAQEAADRDRAALLERQKGDLKREWGQAFESNSEHVRRAWTLGAAAAGIPADKMADAVDKLGDVIGFPAALKLFSFYGGHFAEDKAHGMGGGGDISQAATAAMLYDKSGMNP